MAVISANFLLPFTGGEGVVGSNPAAPTNFSRINNELGRYGVKAALLALDFGTKFGAKIIPILLY